MARNRNSRRRIGFTLMEVLLVLVILVILGSVVGVSISNTRKKGLIGSAKVQLNAFKGPLENYHTDLGGYPTTQQGLQALRVAPADLRTPAKWAGPYTGGEIMADPWGNAYEFESDGATYRMWSWGPNATNEQGGGDDVLVTGE